MATVRSYGHCRAFGRFRDACKAPEVRSESFYAMCKEQYGTIRAILKNRPEVAPAQEDRVDIASTAIAPFSYFGTCGWSSQPHSIPVEILYLKLRKHLFAGFGGA